MPCPACHRADIELEYTRERSEVTRPQGCLSMTWGCGITIVLALVASLFHPLLSVLILLAGFGYVLFGFGDERTTYIDKHYRCRQCGYQWTETDEV